MNIVMNCCNNRSDFKMGKFDLMKVPALHG